MRKYVCRACADGEGPDQPAHPRGLIRAFAVRLHNNTIMDITQTHTNGPGETAYASAGLGFTSRVFPEETFLVYTTLLNRSTTKPRLATSRISILFSSINYNY